MAVGLHAVNKSGVQPGETVLALGCGPIGIAVIAALRAADRIHRGSRFFGESAASWALSWAPIRRSTRRRARRFDTVTPAVVFEAVGIPGIIDDVYAEPGTDRLVVVGVRM